MQTNRTTKATKQNVLFCALMVVGLVLYVLTDAVIDGLGWAGTLITIVLYLAWRYTLTLCQDETPNKVSVKVKPLRRLTVGARVSPGRCPLCHTSFAGPAEISRCLGCETLLHTACQDELGGCPTLGCSEQRPRRRER